VIKVGNPLNHHENAATWKAVGQTSTGANGYWKDKLSQCCVLGSRMMRRETVMRPTLRNLIVIFVILQGISTASVLYIAWRVKDIYDAIPGEPITVTIEQKKQ
jgi:hypothetical protein